MPPVSRPPRPLWTLVLGCAATFMLLLDISVVTVALPPLLGDAYPGRARATALGIWGATIGAPTAVGPLVGGLLTDTFGWRSIFLVNVPVGLLAVPLGLRLLVEGRGERRAVDAAGLGLLTGGLLARVFAIVRSGAAGWASAQVEISGLVAVCALAAFVAVELRIAAPMLDLRLLATPDLAAATVSVAALAVGLTPVLIFLAVYFQGGLGASSTGAGLMLLPATVASAIASGVTGRVLLARLPLPSILAGASSLVATGLALMTLLHDKSAWTVLVPGLTIAGIGWGTINPAATEGALASVPPQAAAMASGLVQVTRQIGIAVGVAALGALFQPHVEHALGGTGA